MIQTHWSVWVFGLLLPPLVALFYCTMVVGMYANFYEVTIPEKMPVLMWRLALLAGSAAIVYGDRYANVHGSDVSDLGRVCMTAVQAALLWTLSFYFCMETRYDDVVGGPNPSRKLNDKTLQDKVVLVTGANAGIGKETARQLAELGAARVVLACRSPKRGQAALEELKQLQTKKKALQYSLLECDLGDYKSVRKAVQELKERGDIPQIDILVLNAGVMMGEQTTTKDGHETMMQANLLGHFLLTRLLMKENLLKPDKKKPPRVVHLSSCTHQIAVAGHGGMDLDDLMCSKTRKYTLFGQYGQTKLGNVLFAKEMARRYSGKIVSLAVHPGTVRTEVTRHMPFWLKAGNDAFAWLVAACQKTVAQGAWCSVSAATMDVDVALMSSVELDAKEERGEEEDKNDDGIPNGAYLYNGKVRQTDPYTYNEADASKLWDMSEKLVGLEQK